MTIIINNYNNSPNIKLGTMIIVIVMILVLVLVGVVVVVGGGGGGVAVAVVVLWPGLTEQHLNSPGVLNHCLGFRGLGFWC